MTIYNYVYDPDKGYPENGVAPGTKFDDITDPWVYTRVTAPG